MGGDLGVHPLKYPVVKALHVLRREGGIQRRQLVQYTAQRPNVRTLVIRFVLPNLGTRIVRRTCLRLENPHFGNLAHIQIT